ncbi:amino acid adenylation domain-containing protein [Desulfobacterales bacterium HSG2]|nr:amino acid adenylation domain-containing protein [Desulfobacterales bacterium HSG2]
MTQAQDSLKKDVFSELGIIFKKASGIDIHTVDTLTNLFGLGIDSLMIARIGLGIEKHFGIPMKMSQFYKERDTIDKIASYIERNLPPDWTTSLNNEKDVEHLNIERKAEPVTKTHPIAGSEASVERIMNMQMEAMSSIMSQQLEVLKTRRHQIGSAEAGGIDVGLETFAGKVEHVTIVSGKPGLETFAGKGDHVTTVSGKPGNVNLREMKFDEDELTTEQQIFLDDFIKQYIERTKKSKAHVDKFRPVHTDWINSLGFRRSLKEIKYPIVASHSDGSKIWDIDGNEYIDIAMGYGVGFLGHKPPFVTEAVKEQLEKGFELGFQNRMAGEVAALICELTGTERAAFCNTGSEAVMCAVRVARAVTGKNKIVMFSGSYHGNFDGVLASPGNEGVVPVAPGTTFGMVQDVIILNYGVPESLKIIQRHSAEIAAVLVEPVQSRLPGFQPKDFLHELREVTLQNGIALLFDEMITGFRIHPGGAQAWFGIKADIVTYGKIVAGGMPIGVVAGKSAYMDIIDGGMWRFGDNSHPGEKTIFFAGTFCKHPLTMAAAKASLTYLRDQGPGLQQKINERTSNFISVLNDFFEKENVAVKAEHFGSLFRFESFGKYHLHLQPIEMEIFFNLLMAKGVYTWEKRVNVFSIRHTDEDIEYIKEKVKESIREMRDGGFMLEADSSKIIRTFPLTEPQKQLWFLTRLNPNANPAYIESAAVELRGPIQLQNFQHAVRELASRHQALRTVVRDEGENQTYLPSLDVELSVIEFTDMTAEGLQAEKEKWLKKNSLMEMDLEAGPPCQFSLIKLDKDLHILVINLHHIFIDGLSVMTLFRDLGFLYSAACRGETERPESPPQPEDFINWQDDYFKSDECKKDETFWLNQFSGGFPMLDFPTDYPRPAIFSFRGARYHARIDKSLYARVREVGRANQCTPFMTLLAAYAALIHRVTGSEEILIGFPTSGRFFENSENLVGYCTHLVPFKSSMDFSQSYEDYLDKARQSLLNAYEHQKYPFSELIRKLDTEMDVSRGSILSFEFNLDSFSGFPEMHDLEIAQANLPLSYVKYDLNLDILEIEGDLHLKFEYATDLFCEKSIGRLAEQYMTLLEGIADAPVTPVGKLPVLTRAARQQIMVEWNDTEKKIPSDRCFHEIFEEQAAQWPNRIAAISGTTEITYGELNSGANRFAQILTEHGVVKDSVVALLAKRNIDFLTAILAIFKSGGAYIPLDPLHPSRRLTQIVTESQTALVVVANILTPLMNQAIESLPDEKRPRIVCLEDMLKEERANDNLLLRCDSSNLSYVIYTSGSTGVPKGAMVEHRGMLNHLYAKIFDLGITKEDIIAQNASQCFDISVWQFLSALLVGGRVHIFSDETTHDPVRLLNRVAEKGITILELVPSMLRMLLDEIERGDSRSDLRSLRWLVPTGEALPPQLCARWFEFYPNIPMLNAYGPTECSDDVSHFRIDKAPGPEVANIPVGSPIINTKLYILDKRSEPLPIGAIGELHVGGICVGRGYLNNPLKTGDAFVSDPFSDDPEARLYKTGDLARYLPDGNIEFLGRMDYQVKIRGFRIELGEIEVLLNRHSSIREAVVVVREDDPGDQRLVAYFVPRKGKKEGIYELRKYLNDKLPDYMVPAHLVSLPQFKLTPNGKIDRKALPRPDETEMLSDSEYEAPRNTVEKTIAYVWGEVLKRKKIGIHDNYFALGGDSIKAIQIAAQLKKEHLEMQVVDIFTYPDIYQLATAVKQTDDKPVQQRRVKEYFRNKKKSELTPSDLTYKSLSPDELDNIKAGMPDKAEIEDIYPLLPMHHGILFHALYEKNAHAYFVQHSMRIHEKTDVNIFEKSWNELLKRYDSLRSLFVVKDVPEPLQIVLKERKVDFYYEDIRTMPQSEHDAYIEQFRLKDRNRPFDLGRDVLIRVSLIQLDEFLFEFNYSSHHVLLDGWGSGIMLKDFFQIYNALKKGETPDLPRPVPYKNYVMWFNYQDISKAKDYWENYLKDYSQSATLRQSNEQNRTKGYYNKELSFKLDEALSARLNRLASGCQTTLNTAIQVLWGILLGRYNDTDDVVFGIVVSGRPAEVKGIDRIVGLLINTVPLRIRMNPDEIIGDLLKRTQKEALNGTKYHHYSLADIQAGTSLKNRLTDHILAFENYPFEEEVNDEISKISEGIDSVRMFEQLHYDLNVIVIPGTRIHFLFSYNGNVYTEEYLERIGEHIIKIVSGMNSDTKLSDIEMLSDKEKKEYEARKRESDHLKEQMVAEFDM